MNLSRKSLRNRLVSVAVGLVWLSSATPCVADPSGRVECGILGQGSHAHAAGDEAHHHDHEAKQQAGPEHDHHGRTATTCCELTGKNAVTVSASLSPLPPRVSFLILAPSSANTHPGLAITPNRPVFRVAHGPPIYLQTTSLRI